MKSLARTCSRLTLLLCLLGLRSLALQAAPDARPNIVFILADDLGYGDVHCLNPGHSRIATPNIDRLASQGMTFTEAHSSSAVCTPSRYSILTGRYNWRSRLQSGVLEGFSPPLLSEGRLTVAELLRQSGYQTACIGKWHLGLTFSKANGERDLAGRITNGPKQHGFDFFYGISASLDMPPFAFIEDDHFTQRPSVTKKWVRSGPAAPDFEAVDVLPELARRAGAFVAASAAARQPFFLYLPLTSPHTPLVPTKEWEGKSSIGPYGDFVMETDWAIGKVLAALDRNNLADNTLVMLSSDNGCAPYIGVAALEQQGHFPSADRRGYKADIWDGGHRIPLIARWPGKVAPGSTCNQLVCLVDLMGTCADILRQKLPENAGEDSVSFLPALLGEGRATSRNAVVSHSINGSFAIRQGNWKLELCPGSGGWSDPKPGSKEAKDLPPVQLYDLGAEVGEKKNLEAEHPDIVARLTALLEKYVADGRSTPGLKQTNDVPIHLWKETKRTAARRKIQL